MSATPLSDFLYFVSYLVRLVLSVCSLSFVTTYKSGANIADTYEQWRSEQYRMDVQHNTFGWANDDRDTSYDFHALQSFKIKLEDYRRDGNLRELCSHLRVQSSRNISTILSPALYVHSSIQTKRLIHDYIREVRKCVTYVSRAGVETPRHESGTNVVVSMQERRQSLRDMRQAMGRTTLVLQGGATVSLCHFGVVKALHRRRLLPRIITGTGHGALVAALVGITPDPGLLDLLSGNSINLDAFRRARAQRKSTDEFKPKFARWRDDVLRRIRRFFYTGHFFDINVLAECARDNLGDLTFEEAYARSGRIVNITIAMPNVAGTPQLLNYITAPHVVVWSAVAASVATSKRMWAPAHLFCKDDTGIITQYFAVDSHENATPRSTVHAGSPLERIGELFNVNHYIVSQTRPYIVPFIRIQDWTGQYPIIGALVRVTFREAVHWLDATCRAGLVPNFIQRIMIDEVVPSSANWSKFVIAPDLELSDYLTVFDVPTSKGIDDWALKGERSVWPKMCQLKIRCSVEFELDAACQGDNRPFSIATNGTE